MHNYGCCLCMLILFACVHFMSAQCPGKNSSLEELVSNSIVGVLGYACSNGDNIATTDMFNFTSMV